MTSQAFLSVLPFLVLKRFPCWSSPETENKSQRCDVYSPTNLLSMLQVTKLWSPDGGNEASTTQKSAANNPESMSSMDKNAVSMITENSQLKKILAEVNSLTTVFETLMSNPTLGRSVPFWMHTIYRSSLSHFDLRYPSNEIQNMILRPHFDTTVWPNWVGKYRKRKRLFHLIDHL